jgi:hypothetical protein
MPPVRCCLHFPRERDDDDVVYHGRSFMIVFESFHCAESVLCSRRCTACISMLREEVAPSGGEEEDLERLRCRFGSSYRA